MRLVFSLVPPLLLAGLTETAAPGELADPVVLEADGQSIDVEVGHAHPFVADFDGDGVRDLLVGQFGNGKLRIYRNGGTDAEPRFEEFTWFRAGGKLGTVPAG